MACEVYFEIFLLFHFSLVLFVFSSEKNETALNRVELLWYRLSLLIKSQVHPAQKREETFTSDEVHHGCQGWRNSVLPFLLLFSLKSPPKICRAIQEGLKLNLLNGKQHPFHHTKYLTYLTVCIYDRNIYI